MPHPEARRALNRGVAGLLLAALLPAGAAHAQIYKWVDSQGRTHYGEKPADGTPAKPIAPPTQPSEPARANTPAKWKEMERDLRTRRLDRERAEDAEKKAAGSAERQRQCRAAEREIRILESQAPVFTRDAKGERVYATDEVRERELKAWKQKYQESCT